MNDSNISGNNIYEKEQKMKDKLKEELIYITQNNLKTAVNKYENFVEKLLNERFEKRKAEIYEYGKKKNAKESKKIKEKAENEILMMKGTDQYLKEMVKFEFDKIFNEDLKKLQEGIDDIFNMDGIDRNIKSIYNSINSDEYSVQKIKEKCENSKTKFEEIYRQYLLTNMKYKEELEVYNKRQEQILKENIDCKKEYNDINNYLNNFKINNNLLLKHFIFYYFYLVNNLYYYFKFLKMIC